jgi:hypothetical protein
MKSKQNSDPKLAIQSSSNIMRQDDFIKLNFRGSDYKFPRIVLNQYIVKKCIDKGSFGAVFDCLDGINNS